MTTIAAALQADLASAARTDALHAAVRAYVAARRAWVNAVQGDTALTELQAEYQIAADALDEAAEAWVGETE